MMVPILHTNGMTAYAFANNWSISSSFSVYATALTFMLGSLDQLADHGLNDANVAIERTTDDPAGECNPKVGG